MKIKPVSSILALLGCMLTIQIKAQQPPSNKDTETGTITGKVLQGSNKEPIPFATIALLNEDDSTVITGTAADERGGFILKPVRYGSYIIKVGTMGFTPYYAKVSPNLERPLWDLGTITLQTGSRNLKEVVITGQQQMFKMNKDSIIFTPDENFLPGGTAMELLEYVPGLTIDANNNITMEGKDQVKFYVDDKPIALTGMDYNSYLQNTPSFMIERIEVLKAPPDPVEAEQALVEGRTNIRYINIITRKIQFRGYSAAFTAGVDSRRNLNVKMRYNMNLAPFQITYFNNGQYNSDSSYLSRTYFPQNPTADTSYLEQKNFRTNYNYNHNLNGRYELKMTEKEKLRGSVTLGWTGDGSNGENNSIYADEAHKPTRTINQENLNRKNGYRAVTDWNYLKEYDSIPDKKLEAGFNFVKSNGSGYGNNDYFYDMSGEKSMQRNKRRNGNWSTRLNFHFRNALSNKRYYDLSSNVELNRGNNRNLASRQNVTDTELLFAPRLSSNYSNFEQKYSANVSYGRRDQKFGYNMTGRLGYEGSKSEEDYAGNRFNNETYELRSSLGMNFSPRKDHMLNMRVNPGIQFFNQMALLDSLRNRVPFKYTNFSPGVNVQYDLKDQQLTLNYNRNIDRPTPDQLNPFINTTDTLNIRFGNPNLRPSFTKDYRAEYLYQYKSHQFKAGVEAQDAGDIISRYTKVEQVGNTIYTSSTFVNLASRKDRSAYITVNSHFFKAIQNNKGSINLNINGGLRYYNTTTDGGEEGKDAVSEKFAHVEGVTSNLTAWAAYRIRVFSISVNGRYNGPRYYAQGKTEGRFNSGMRGQVNLFQRKLNVAFSVENIFGSSVRNSYELTNAYEQYSNARRNVRYLSLNITYNIRKFTKLGQKGPKDYEKQEDLKMEDAQGNEIGGGRGGNRGGGDGGGNRRGN